MRGREIRFEFEVEIVSGEEGQELSLKQARAIRHILTWVQQNRAAISGEPDQRAALTDQDVD